MHTVFTQLVESANKTITPGVLYVLATPIGNLSDISARALAVLARADVLCAEDTRVARHLLLAYGLANKKLVSLHRYNECALTDQIINYLRSGAVVVQISDAGTPTISDPGARLVQAVRQADLRVCPIPGASASITALSVSGVLESSFFFHGFLPAKTALRRQTLAQWRLVNHSVVCYEAPHRLLATLEDIVTELGAQRPLVLARELTKLFETVAALPAAQMLSWVQADLNQQKGECVLIIDAAAHLAVSRDLSSDAVECLSLLLQSLSLRHAVDLAAQLTQARKKDLYAYALTLKSGQKTEDRRQKTEFG